MDEELLKTMFLKSRDHYDGAKRWSFILLLVCVLFHLTTFSRFVDLGKKQIASQAEKGALLRLEGAAAEIKLDLDRLDGMIMKPLGSRLDRMLSDLKSDFQALDRSVAGIRTPVTADFTRTSGEAPLEENETTGMILQMSGLQSRAPKKVFQLGDELTQRIESAENIHRLREILLPVIEQQIVHKRFSELNRYWQDDHLSRIKNQTDILRKSIQRKRSSFPEEKVTWDEITQSLDQIDEVSTGLKFEPPGDSEWWASVAGKMAVMSGIEEAAEKKLIDATKGSRALGGLMKKVKAALEKQQELQSKLKEELKDLEENFEEQKAKLAHLNKAFAFISLDLPFVVAIYPLLLGILLAAIAIWPAYRLQELTKTARILGRKGPGAFFPLEWLFLSGIRGALAEIKDDAITDEQIRRQYERHNHRLLMDVSMRGLIFCAWLVIGALQCAGLSAVDSATSAFLTGFGCLLVLCSQGYRWVAGRMIL